MKQFLSHMSSYSSCWIFDMFILYHRKLLFMSLLNPYSVFYE